jgi:hypothetical protein
MRISYSFFLLLIVWSSIAQTQKDSINNFVFLSNDFDNEWTPKSAKLCVDGSVGSNLFNSAMFNDVLFRSGFISDGKKEFLESPEERTRLYAQFRSEMEYKISSNLGVYVKNKNIAGYSGSTKFTQLVMFGNANFQNQKVSSGDLQFISAAQTSAGITLKSFIGTNTSTKLGIGLNVISNYKQLNASLVSLYTAGAGQYIEAEFKDFYISKRSLGLIGVGLDINYGIEVAVNEKSKLSFSVADFNVNRLINQKSIYLDTAFTFSGYKYQFGNNEATFSEYIDTSFSAYINRGTKVEKWLMLPSHLSLSYSHLLSKKTNLTIDLTTIGFGNFGTAVSVSLDQRLGENVKILSAVGFGNFTGFTWREALEYRTGNGLHFYVNIMGLQSFLMPLQTHNYGLGIGLAKRF